MASSSANSHGDTRDYEERAEERALTGLLSDDTLLHILRRLSTRELLSSMAFVCHRWRRLCQVYELLPSPLSSSKKPWGNMRGKRLLELAATHASTLESIHLQGLKLFTIKEVIALCRNVPRLRDFAIISCPDFVTRDLELVAAQLPTQLVSLAIYRDGESGFPCQMDDTILGQLHQRCPHLQKLDLDLYGVITTKGLDGLLQACQFLTSLDLYSNFLGWPEVAQVFKGCEALSHFSLVSSRLLITDSGSDDDESKDGFSNIYRRGRSSKNWGRREGFHVAVAASLGLEMPKHLTSLRLYSVPYRSVPFELPPMLEMLRSRGHQLQQLHAQGVFNTSWQTISVWCANLKLLDLSHLRQDSHFRQDSLMLTGVEGVVLCGLIQLLKKLEHIALPSATDHVLTELGRFCPNLREVHFLDSNPKNTAVTDRGVVAVAEGCPDLRVLSLSGCQNLTISSARALAFHCRKLEVLLLHRCDNFTDAAVVALLPRLSSSLVYLHLVGCPITQSTLDAIRQYAKVTSLRVVAIAKSLWYRSKAVIADIHSCNPRLRIRIESMILWDGFYHGRLS